MDLKVAVVQFDIIWEDTEANLSYLTNQFEKLDADTDLVVLPEMFHCGFSMSAQKNVQEDGGDVLQWMRQMSTRYSIALIGSVVVGTDGGVTNRLYVVEGDKVASYDKRHLFTMGGEHLYYQKGTERIIVEVKGWRLCPLICYDLRFPVWSRNQGEEYDALIYVANWPASRIDVWNTLLKARAIENQSYVIGVNRIGKDKSLEYNGSSQVIDARGNALMNTGDNNVIAYVLLDKVELARFRSVFPVLKDADRYELKVSN
ncbi:amidohydrolase [Carboxylicivirga sp. RSCT41]|uniref:amidohydrolase n=1 Tax=Carboxylicivirga agarovorans TaxID=3417570 RepID=UPI003D342827